MLFSGVSLALEAGGALHVAGPNGIGKSSLLRILAGLARPFSGELTRQGNLSLLDERLALDEHQPLGKALGFWCRIDGCAPTAHTELLGLGDLLDVPVRYLSTGQRKRAALARMIGQQSPIWLLDEPLNGLDAEGVSLLETLTHDHCTHGGIAVIASHQPFRFDGLETMQLADFAQ